MKLVIDISEKDYELACKYPEVLFGAYAKCIKNGTPFINTSTIIEADKAKNEVDENGI